MINARGRKLKLKPGDWFNAYIRPSDISKADDGLNLKGKGSIDFNGVERAGRKATRCPEQVLSVKFGWVKTAYSNYSTQQWDFLKVKVKDVAFWEAHAALGEINNVESGNYDRCIKCEYSYPSDACDAIDCCGRTETKNKEKQNNG